MNIADLKEGEKGIINDMNYDQIPLKLIELGCLQGNEVELVQRAPFKDPICVKINGSVLAIREDLAKMISISSH